jgi:hypothetical protein
MLKARIADWILSLVIDPQRSAAAVGDLMEECSGSALRFWMSAGRIFIFALWDTFGTSWKRILQLTACGLLLETAGSFAMIPIIVGTAWLMGFADGSRWTSFVWVTSPELIGGALGLVLLVLMEFLAGTWIARWSRGLEIAVCLAVVAGEAVFGGVIDMVFVGTLTSWSTAAFVAQIALFSGAVLERRRRIAG